MATIKIADTGLNEVGGTVTYTQVDSGSWIDFTGFRFGFQFPATATDNSTQVLADSSNLTFSPNEVESLSAPRISMAGLVDIDTNSGVITKLIQLQRSLGVKRLAGGLGVFGVLPEASGTSPNYISVIITNISVEENLRGSTNTVAVTVEFQQVV